MHPDKIKYGVKETTEIIDDNGSTKTRQYKYENGDVQKPVRHKYEIRHRTDKTDIASIEKIISDLAADFTKLDSGIRLERTKAGELNGYFNVVEFYTKLQY